MKNLLTHTLYLLDELRENLEMIKDEGKLSENTYEKHYNELCVLEDTLQRKVRQKKRIY